MIDLLFYGSVMLLVVGCWLKLAAWASREVEWFDPAHRLDSIYEETVEGRKRNDW